MMEGCSSFTPNVTPKNLKHCMSHFGNRSSVGGRLVIGLPCRNRSSTVHLDSVMEKKNLSVHAQSPSKQKKTIACAAD
jgi:altronate dehydratase